MELSANLIPWCFGSITLFALGFLLLSTVVGEVADFADGLLGSVEGFLEGLGLDAFAGGDLDGVEGGKGIGCGAMMAFLAGFGISGLIASLLGALWVGSVLSGMGGGLLVGVAYLSAFRLLLRQQTSGVTRASELVGSMARVTTNASPGSVGEAMVEAQGARKRYPTKELDGHDLRRGDLVRVESVEGGMLYVRKTPRSENAAIEGGE